MTNTELPDGAGTATPEKGEATGQGGFRGTEQNGRPNCADVQEPAQQARQKRLASIRVHLALKSHSLHELTCGGLLIARWDRAAHCSDLGAVAAFLRRIGGAA